MVDVAVGVVGKGCGVEGQLGPGNLRPGRGKLGWGCPSCSVEVDTGLRGNQLAAVAVGSRAVVAVVAAVAGGPVGPADVHGPDVDHSTLGFRSGLPGRWSCSLLR